MNLLISDLVDLAAIESGKLRVNIGPLELPALIADVRSRIDVVAQQRGIRRPVLDLILTLGDRKTRVAGGLWAISMSDYRAAELQRAGVPAQELERVRGVNAIVNLEHGMVVTVEHAIANSRRYHR